MHIFFRIIPKLAFALGGRNVVRTAYICICLWVVLIGTEIFCISFGVRIPCVYKGLSFYFFCHSKADIAVLREVFLLEEYVWPQIENPKIIIDLGAHVGDTALFYHASYPNARIYAVEPDPESFRLLQINTKDFEKITPIHAAITKETGVLTLYVSAQSSLRGSTIKREKTTKEITVPALCLSDLYAQYSISKADLIKFDIEGGEQDMFGSLGPEAYATAYIGEFHSDLTKSTPEVFVSLFNVFDVRMEPMGRNKRFKIQAIKKH